MYAIPIHVSYVPIIHVTCVSYFRSIINVIYTGVNDI